MKLDVEPRLSNGPGLFASLMDWARKVVQATNESTDKVAANTTSIAGKVDRSGDTMTGALNLVGNSTAVTQASSDNTTKIATTAWAKVGFAISIAAVGYIKFPDWLGGLIVQWGTSSVTTDAAGLAGITFPLTFPNSIRAVVVSNGDSSTGNLHVQSYITGFPTTSTHGIHTTNAGTGANYAGSFRCNWVAFGN